MVRSAHLQRLSIIGLPYSLDLTLKWDVSYSGFQVRGRRQGRLSGIPSYKLHPNQAFNS